MNMLSRVVDIFTFEREGWGKNGAYFIGLKQYSNGLILNRSYASRYLSYDSNNSIRITTLVIRRVSNHSDINNPMFIVKHRIKQYGLMY